MGKTVVVIGGVAGGMSFATRYRRLNEEDHVIVFERGPYVSFANCGLPYYISGEIAERDNLLVTTQATLEERFDLDIRPYHEVLKIDPKNRKVKVLHEGQEFEQSYDELVLSVGARPFVLDIAGADKSRIFTLRNIPDVDKIMAALENPEIKHALVIGAGFIGLEMAENLHKRGLKVSVVEKAPQILPPLDEEMAAFASEELVKQGVALYTGTSVTHFEGSEAILENNQRVKADIVIMAIGVIPESDLAKDAGLKLGMRGGIIVDENYRTSDDAIHAIGDAIIVKHIVSQEDVMIALASPANRQGRHLADILSGIEHKNSGSLGTAIVRLFDLSVASTGLNERQLKGRPIQVMHLFANDHAGYFPGASPINLKVIYDKETLALLGAQGVGQKGVDKRIDVIAALIKMGAKVTDLQELELAYAPPFGSAKDIVNMAGYVGQNLNQGITDMIQWHEIKAKSEEDVIFLDVRNEEERKQGFLKHSFHIPLASLRQEYMKLPLDKEIIVYCESGVRSYNAERFLKNKGYKVSNLDGSFNLIKTAAKELITYVL